LFYEYFENVSVFSTEQNHPVSVPIEQSGGDEKLRTGDTMGVAIQQANSASVIKVLFRFSRRKAGASRAWIPREAANRAKDTMDHPSCVARDLPVLELVSPLELAIALFSFQVVSLKVESGSFAVSSSARTKRLGSPELPWGLWRYSPQSHAELGPTHTKPLTHASLPPTSAAIMEKGIQSQKRVEEVEDLAIPSVCLRELAQPRDRHIAVIPELEEWQLRPDGSPMLAEPLDQERR
jgi:hypothetical protein